MNTKTRPRTNRTELLRVRVRPSTKRTLERAAARLDTDQSSLIRLALREYLRQHLPDAA